MTARNRTRATYSRDYFRGPKALRGDTRPGKTVKVTIRYYPDELEKLRKRSVKAETNLADYIRTKSLR